MLASTLGACSPDLPAEAGHGHDEEPAPVVLTVWDQGYEIFYEVLPPVVGEPFELAFHVTRLADGAPRSTGAVRLRFATPSGAEHLEELEAPRRPGLYLPRVVLSAPGTCGFSVEIPGEKGPVRIELPALVVHPDAESAAHADVGVAPEGVQFLKEQQWLLELRTELVATRALEQRIVVPGRIESVPARRGVVSPPLAGRLEPPPAGVLPALGTRVQAGELVGFVQPPWSELALRVQEARAERRAAEVELSRVEASTARVAELHARDARSDRELEEARFELEGARARVASARALADVGAALHAGQGDGESLVPRFALVAPVGGVVQAVGAALGEMVEPGEEVLRVLDTSVVQLVAHPSPEQLAQVDPALPPHCTRHGGSNETEEIALADVRLVLVSGAITEPGHTVPIVYEFTNPDGALLDGELVEVGLSTGGAREVLAVPISALVDDAGQPTAYVQVAGETFVRRDLELGARSAGYVEVVRGLEPGERVVTRRAYAIRLASASGSVPVHSH